MTHARVVLLAVFVTSLCAPIMAGCSIQDLALEGRACPCTTGWMCVAGTCVRCEGDSCEADAARIPADAWARDAPGLDAPSFDDAFEPADAFEPPDAFAPPDAFVLASTCDLPISGRLWCTGFERGGDDFTYINTPEASFSATRVWRGATVGESLSPPAPREGSAFVRELALPNAAGEHIHLTGWIHRVGDASGRDVSLFQIADAAYAYRIALGLDPGGRVRLLLGYPEFNVAFFGDDAQVPADRWVCVRIDAQIGDPGSVRVWLTPEGDTEREVVGSWLRSPVITRHTGSGYSQLSVGVHTTAAGHRVLFDEIALGTAPQPCVP